MTWLNPATLGFAVRRKLADLGAGARLFGRLIALGGAAFARARLVSEQVHLLGNLSLAIIGVSGLFVGFVLGLQGYYTLQRYGSADALGCWSRCRWCASWGRSSPRCCSPGAPAPRSPPRSA